MDIIFESKRALSIFYAIAWFAALDECQTEGREFNIIWSK